MSLSKKSTKIIMLIAYTCLIIYFLFFAFHRNAGSSKDGLAFSFAINQIPLWFPKHFTLDIIKLWIFSLGNVIAFIPFGVLIPCNLPTVHRKYWKCLLIFLISISILECIQGVTGYGSFDLEDILVNTLGFSIGYIAMKAANRGNNVVKNIMIFMITAVLGTVVCIGIAQMLNPLIRGY